MKMFKKKMDGEKKMTATIQRSTVNSKTGAVTKSAPKKMELKSISAKEFNSSTPKSKPTVKSKPMPKAKPFSPKAQAAGRAAAEKSRAEGKKLGALGRFEERTMQGMLNAGGKKLDTKGVKRSKTGGVIDPTGRYSGLNNKQLGY